MIRLKNLILVVINEISMKKNMTQQDINDRPEDFHEHCKIFLLQKKLNPTIFFISC